MASSVWGKVPFPKHCILVAGSVALSLDSAFFCSDSQWESPWGRLQRCSSVRATLQHVEIVARLPQLALKSIPILSPRTGNCNRIWENNCLPSCFARRFPPSGNSSALPSLLLFTLYYPHIPFRFNLYNVIVLNTLPTNPYWKSIPLDITPSSQTSIGFGYSFGSSGSALLTIAKFDSYVKCWLYQLRNALLRPTHLFFLLASSFCSFISVWESSLKWSLKFFLSMRISDNL